ncbi:HAAS signaling domain-containing protein [Bacillus sp. S10(2024)]|uniref:HAAS signaling domain-containing protein n=1 Tax=Bacillus sp. S10(2024) TaxID=3162886 RepID=UPI003D1A7F9D
MNKSEFLKQLGSSLKNIPNSEKKDIISEYETHFISGKQDGKSEEEISKGLGNPKTIAKELHVIYAINNADNKRSLKNMIKAIFSVMSLSFLNFIFIIIAFFLLLLFFPILLALIIATPLLLVSPILLIVVGLIKGFHQIHFSDLYSVFVGFLIGLTIAGISYFAIKHLYSLLVKYLKWNLAILQKY